MEIQSESADSEECSVLCSGSETVSVASESSFDFKSPTEGSLPAGTALINTDGDNYDSNISNEVMDDDDIITSSSSDFEFQSDLDEEIWDDTDDDNDATNVDMNQIDDHVESEKVLLGISLFLYFSQLTYHISERATTTLLLFVKLLLRYAMGLIGGNTILNFLSNSIPKSMCTIRKLINMKQAIKEYVMCPKCDRLYDLSDYIIVENGQEQSKLCEFIKFPRHPQSSHRSKCNTTLMKSVIVGAKKN